MKRFKATNAKPERLDKVLATGLAISRAKIQAMIAKGDVEVEGKPANKKTLVQVGQDIRYVLEKPKRASLFKRTKAPMLEILFEDADVLVVNKPAGCLVHATMTSKELTLVDALIAYHKPIQRVGPDPARAGLVHRLDKFVSGVLIIAKTSEAHTWLKAQFKQRQAQKHYTALVHGKMEKQSDTIALSIERSRQTGKMAAKPISQGGKEAITHYSVTTQYPHHALLDVRIETGRTNQIRAHLFAIHHPIVGDPLYKQKSQKLLNIGRIFLHAYALTLTLPSGKKKTFRAPLPPELETVLQTIPKL